jgi:hypothetical protein
MVWWKVNTKPRPAYSVSILCSKSSSAMCCCCKVFYMTPHLLSSQFVPKTNRDMLYCWLVFFFLSSNQCGAVLTFLWEPAGSSSYIMLWEPDRFSNNFCGLVRTDQGINILNFFKLTWYLDRAVLTYTIPISFDILFSQPSCWIFH